MFNTSNKHRKLSDQIKVKDVMGSMNATDIFRRVYCEVVHWDVNPSACTDEVVHCYSLLAVISVGHRNNLAHPFQCRIHCAVPFRCFGSGWYFVRVPSIALQIFLTLLFQPLPCGDQSEDVSEDRIALFFPPAFVPRWHHLWQEWDPPPSDPLLHELSLQVDLHWSSPFEVSFAVRR